MGLLDMIEIIILSNNRSENYKCIGFTIDMYLRLVFYIYEV